MLVLSRKADESIRIGDVIVEMTVVRIRGDRVWLGFVAPKDVIIKRTELLEKEKSCGDE